MAIWRIPWRLPPRLMPVIPHRRRRRTIRGQCAPSPIMRGRRTNPYAPQHRSRRLCTLSADPRLSAVVRCCPRNRRMTLHTFRLLSAICREVTAHAAPTFPSRGRIAATVVMHSLPAKPSRGRLGHGQTPHGTTLSLSLSLFFPLPPSIPFAFLRRPIRRGSHHLAATSTCAARAAHTTWHWTQTGTVLARAGMSLRLVCLPRSPPGHRSKVQRARHARSMRTVRVRWRAVPMAEWKDELSGPSY